MSPMTPSNRMLPGPPGGPYRPVETAAEGGDSVTFRQVLTVLRRRYQLILAMTLVGASIGLFLASREPATYHANAMLRFAGERQAITGDDEEPNGLPKTTDPLMSIVQLIRSRTVAGLVVDTLGLQLQSRTEDFTTGSLENVHVDPRAAGDSVVLTFRPNDVVARRADRVVTAPYGQIINLGVVQLSVRSRPTIETATLGIGGQEPAIDALLGGLLVTRRTETDVIDVGYTAYDPISAQRVVNSTVQAFQALNVQWARERSRRRREFLAEQLSQTDSMLARAQSRAREFPQPPAAGEQYRQAEGGAGDRAPDRDPHGGARRGPGDLRGAAAAAQVERRGDPRAGGSRPRHGPRHGRQRGDRDDLPSAADLSGSVGLDDDRSLAGVAHQSGRGPVEGPDRLHPGEARGRRQQPGEDARMRAWTPSRPPRKSGASIEVLPAMAEEEMRLNRRVDALAGLGDDLRKDYNRARMAEAVEAGDVDVVDLADVPYAPVLTASAVKLALGLVLGLMLGLLLAYLLEALNTSDAAARGSRGGAARARSGGDSADHRRLRQRPVAPARRCWAPASSSATSAGSLMSGGQTFSIGIEAFRNLRTSLIWSDGGEALKTLVVTSAAPGRGQDPHRRQSRRHPGVRRPSRAARRLRHPPARGSTACSTCRARRV